jgi:hypothetical protein
MLPPVLPAWLVSGVNIAKKEELRGSGERGWAASNGQKGNPTKTGFDRT